MAPHPFSRTINKALINPVAPGCPRSVCRAILTKMSRNVFAGVAALVVVAACGGGTASVGSTDDGGTGADGASLGDGGAGVDALARDGNAADVGTDVATDAPDDVTACAACAPDFCGCGQCADEQVVCTKTPMPCALACATACDLSKYKCACDADRCVRTSPPPANVIPCYATLDCPPGNCCMQRSGPIQGACVPGNACP